MILSWKNILWFQRVSEHVLELGHYEIKESKVCITHSDCVKKKKTYSIHFIIPMLMKVYLYCLFPPIDWFTRSLDAEFIDVTSCFVFAKRKKGGGEGGCFCDSFEVIPQWRCVMYIQKSQHISPQFDQLSLSIQYFFVRWAFLQCWSCRRDYLTGIVTGSPGRRRSHSNSVNTITQTLPTPRIRNISPVRNDAMILGEKRCVINSHELKRQPKGL